MYSYYFIVMKVTIIWNSDVMKVTKPGKTELAWSSHFCSLLPLFALEET